MAVWPNEVRDVRCDETAHRRGLLLLGAARDAAGSQPVALSQRTGAPSPATRRNGSELIVPRAAKQLFQLLLEDHQSVDAERDRGPQLVLGDENVPVCAGGRGKETKIWRVAVPHGVAAGRRLFGDLEAQPLPARESGGDGISRARLAFPCQLSTKRPGGSRLTDPGHADGGSDGPRHCPLDVRAQRGWRRMNLQNAVNGHRCLPA